MNVYCMHALRIAPLPPPPLTHTHTHTVLQTELLQSQGEVRRLLDRVGVASRERAEMVSSTVHTQLLQIADDRTTEAESRARQLEREVGSHTHTHTHTL